MYTKFKNTKKILKIENHKKIVIQQQISTKLYTVAIVIKKAENQEVSEQFENEAQSNDKHLTIGAKEAQTVGVSVSGETKVVERELNHERVHNCFNLRK